MQASSRRILYDRVKAATVSICTRDADGKYSPFGSGFNIDPNGLVITCEHVIAATLIDDLSDPLTDRRARSVTQREWFCVFTIENDDGVFIRALRVLLSKGMTDHDVAAVRLRCTDSILPLPFIDIGDSDQVSEGEPVFTCGFPLGGRLQPEAPTGALFARGIISGVRPFRSKTPREKFLLDMNANEGNSGGALVSEDSASAIGVLNARLREEGGHTTGISCAVPMNLLQKTIDDVRGMTIEAST